MLEIMNITRADIKAITTDVISVNEAPVIMNIAQHKIQIVRNNI